MLEVYWDHKLCPLQERFIVLRMSLFGRVHYQRLHSWCGGELWVDQRKKYADICDVAQVADTRTLPN